MLDDTLKAQLQQYLALLRQPIVLLASLGQDETSANMRELLQTIAGLSDKVRLDLNGQDARKPSFTLKRAGTATSLRFAGLPAAKAPLVRQQRPAREDRHWSTRFGRPRGTD